MIAAILKECSANRSYLSINEERKREREKKKPGRWNDICCYDIPSLYTGEKRVTVTLMMTMTMMIIVRKVSACVKTTSDENKNEMQLMIVMMTMMVHNKR